MYSNSKDEYLDLKQEICYQLAKSFDSFKGDSKLSTWVYKVALFTALAQLRKKQKHLDYVADLPETSLVEDDDSWQEVIMVIKKLPEVDRSVIFLYLEDRPYKEMADILGISESNIGVKLNRIKKKLKEHFNQSSPEWMI